MINLLVISDTHGYPNKIDEVIKRQLVLDEKFQPKYLIFLGDGLDDFEKSRLVSKMCVLDVRGNSNEDYFYLTTVPKDRVVDLGGYKILMMHGHSHAVKSGLGSAIGYAVENDADILLFGHTHAPVSYTLEKGHEIYGITLKKNLTVFNPGSLGYDDVFGVVTLDDSGILCSHGSLK